MTAAELIEQLKALPPDTQIVMSCDAEGNAFSPLSDCGLGVYIAEGTWSGDFYSIEFSANDNCMEEDEWEAHKADPKQSALCLWPI